METSSWKLKYQSYFTTTAQVQPKIHVGISSSCLYSFNQECYILDLKLGFKRRIYSATLFGRASLFNLSVCNMFSFHGPVITTCGVNKTFAILEIHGGFTPIKMTTVPWEEGTCTPVFLAGWGEEHCHDLINLTQLAKMFVRSCLKLHGSIPKVCPISKM